MRCDAEAGCCGSPLLPSGHPRPTSGFRPSATSENNFPEHPETPAPSTGTKRKCKHLPKCVKCHRVSKFHSRWMKFFHKKIAKQILEKEILSKIQCTNMLSRIMGVTVNSFKLLTSVHVGARASFAPPVSEPRISCRSSYHASNSAPHNGPTPGGYGGGRCSHSAVISPISRNAQILGHTLHTGPEGGSRQKQEGWKKWVRYREACKAATC